MHFKKYWKHYLISVIVIFAFYKIGQHYGWFRKKGGSDNDKILAEFINVPMFPDLDYNKQISLNDSDLYSKVLIQYLGASVVFTTGLTEWVGDTNPDKVFSQNLLDYINYKLPAYNQANQNAPIYVAQTISLTDALKLSKFIASNP